MNGWFLIVIAATVAMLLLASREGFSESAGSAKKSGYDLILKAEGQTVEVPPLATPTGGSKDMSPQVTVVPSTSTTSTPAPPFGPSPTAGNTTGGSSTSTAEPTSGGGGDRRKQVFGPQFTSVGDGQGDPARDSSKTTVYPTLLGGGDSKPVTRVEGAGIVAPSKNWTLATDGSLPSFGSLGANEDSKYLPTSRVPGDMDKIPDPYRVSQSWSASNNAYKSDPVPFLTDFSAFQK